MKNSRPPPPKHLSRQAKVWWKKFLAEWELDDPSLLTLGNALELLDQAQEAKVTFERDGSYTSDRFGQKKLHPACLKYRDCMGLAHRLLKSLGLDLVPLHDRPGRPSGS